MSEQDSQGKKPKKKYDYDFSKYNEFKRIASNKCIRCEKIFKFKVYGDDDPRFKRFCQACKSTVNNGGYDIDFTETVGN